ncbi:SEC-C domain-containing protein [Qipengyuania sp. GH25]|uniref:SEC-C domain-containing protein n=1 Tax=Qipengyuania pacifica TaxID=2860199 RepID=A0ABS7JEX7_9SPHN|nr:SEC-C domain-containing protein [Qipengyuania aerophila]MBX7486948.1 SEC-C domain-containing protein [Qipengyuania aerophila]
MINKVQARNDPCPCGSGRRLKHCHGSLQAPDEHAEISDKEIKHVVHKADDEGLRQGEEPKQRAFKNVLRALQMLNIDGVVLVGENAPPIVRRIHAANNLLFRKEDQRDGGIHLGAFLFRDLFCRLSVPMIFGAPMIDFFKMIDLSDYQKIWLGESPDDEARLADQAVDLLDFGYGYMEFGHGRALDPRGQSLIFRSHVQLEAAAATATGAYDYRGTVQSALLGSELAIKAGLAALGLSDGELKALGHNQRKAAAKLGLLETNFDLDRVIRVVTLFPDYVKSRYAGVQPDRTTTGHILMGAQYVASEVTRLFSDRNLRESNSDIAPRTYPA